MNIVDLARKDIGKKEKPGNLGFQNPEHEARLRAVGWQSGWAWCSAQIEAWAWEAFPEKKDAIKGLFVPSAVNTFRNLVKAGYKHDLVPTVGAFVFWQRYHNGNPEWQGHCGVVSEVISPTQFKSIEGNTNSVGSREGDSVQEKSRIIKPEVEDGLKVIGFVTI